MNIKPKKRSQAAMEFMLTYGWAILLVLIVIAALVYLGVLNPSKIFPDKCVFTPGVQCKDYVAYADGYLIGGQMIITDPPVESLSFDLVNGLGKSIYITKINITGDERFSCMQVQIDSCAGQGGNAVNINVRDVDYSFRPASKCFSVRDICDDMVRTCDPETAPEGLCQQIDSTCENPERFLFWPAGERFKQNLVGVTLSEYYSIPCINMPPAGSKVKATVTIDYYEDDPAFTHTISGDIILTVQERTQ